MTPPVALRGLVDHRAQTVPLIEKRCSGRPEIQDDVVLSVIFFRRASKIQIQQLVVPSGRGIRQRSLGVSTPAKSVISEEKVRPLIRDAGLEK